MTKQKRKNREYQGTFAEKKKEEGYVSVQYWIPRGSKDNVKKYITRINKVYEDSK